MTRPSFLRCCGPTRHILAPLSGKMSIVVSWMLLDFLLRIGVSVAGISLVL